MPRPSVMPPGSRPPLQPPSQPPPPMITPTATRMSPSTSSRIESILKNRAMASEVPYVGTAGSWRKELQTIRDDTTQSEGVDGANEGGNIEDRETPDANSDQPLLRGPLRHKSVHDSAMPRSLPLASALGSIAEEYLKLDVLSEGNDASQYIGFLLDTIQNLQSRVDFLSATGHKENLDSDTDSDTESNSVIDPLPDAKARHQVLHRVFCGSHLHNHDIATYEDEPVLTTIDSGILTGEEVICGRVEVHDVKTYLRTRPEIQFVVFKESFCTVEPKQFTAHQRGEIRVSHKDFEDYRNNISPRKERLKITSPLLEQALEQVATCMSDTIDFDDGPDESKEVEAPYQFLFHHRRKLKDFVKTARAEVKAAVTVLLDYLNENFEAEYQEAESLFEKRIVSESHIERLYKPNQIVVVKENEQLIAVCLDEWPVKRFGAMRFSGWKWCFDGRRLEREPWYKGWDMHITNTKDVQQLPVYPVEYLDPGALETLTERGRKFWRLKYHKLVAYNGWDAHHDYHYFNERFMVDMSTYTKMFPNKVGLFAHDEAGDFDNLPARINVDEELTDDELLLLPRRTHGYSLREKKWGAMHLPTTKLNDFKHGANHLVSVSINIEQITEVEWNKKAFDLLVLEDDTKNLLRALIDVRMSKAKKFDDIVSGKGNGLVMLLHGSPGTGKSLTAESVAEFAEKPLYRVTCGDIGTVPEKVENYLNTIFYLGKTWDCVLLLDEADVFLEERSVNDLQRNSLVSIFLRSLEFYEGIIILTSNRVGTFDEAFQSRIRVALRYEPLSARSRRAIWKNFFNMLMDDDDEVKVNIPNLDRRLDDLASYKMNGRQIRNILLTARQLALHQQERLEWAHLLQVLKLSDSFNKYLLDVRGHSDEDWAKSQALR